MTDWPATPYLADNTLHVCDWLELMQALPDGSVDMILTDMPYGTTACSWDTVIDLAAWWAEVKRVMKPRGAVVCTGSEPFSSILRTSWLEGYKYDWVWIKNRPTGFINAWNRPMKKHENILIFSLGTIANLSANLMTYKPQGIRQVREIHKQNVLTTASENHFIGTRPSHKTTWLREYRDFPTSILEVDNSNNRQHPTQKPVALFEYLIRTYTQPGELVVDPFVGSGTTAVAAKITGRRFICGDQSAEYIDIARKRVFPTFGQPPKRKREEQPITDLPLFAALA